MSCRLGHAARRTWPISAELKLYQKPLREVGVFRVAIESWTGKVKFASNEPAAVRRKIIARLRERGRALDVLTALEIEGTLGEE